MKARAVLLLLTVALFAFAACGSDDNPAAPATKPPSQFNTSNMPITIPGSTVQFGNMSTDGSGNLLITPGYNGGTLFTVSRSTGQLRIVATNIGSMDLMSSVYDPDSNVTYVGTRGNPVQIYTVNMVDGTSSLLVDLGSLETANDLLIAPAGFGAYGGHLLVCTRSGGVVAVDLANPVGGTQVAAGGFNSGVFGSDGTLYCTVASSDQVVTVSPTGTVTPFVTVRSGLDGITFSGSKLYVASSDRDSVFTVSVPGGNIAPYAAANFDGGWYPSGLVFDNGKLITGVGPGAYIVDVVTP